MGWGDVIRLLTKGGIQIEFDSENSDSTWDIFDSTSGTFVGRLEVDIDDMLVGADILPDFRRKGVATAVVVYLVTREGRQFTFWKPDGQTYEDARHLTIEGAAWAHSLVQQGFASWAQDEYERADDDEW